MNNEKQPEDEHDSVKQDYVFRVSVVDSCLQNNKADPRLIAINHMQNKTFELIYGCVLHIWILYL